MRERGRDRVAYVLRTLTTARIEHLRHAPLPGFLHFLYAVVTPTMDYVGLPLRRRLGGWGRQRERERARTEALRVLERDAGPTRRRACADWADSAQDAGRWLEARVLESGARDRLLDWAPGLGAASRAPLRAVRTLVAAERESREPEQAAGATEPGAGVLACRAAAESLPFADGSFDAVLSRFGLLFCPEPERALLEFRRVLRPGGAAGFLVWGPIDANTRLSVARQTLGDLFGSDACETAWPEAFGEPGRLASAVERAGFAHVEENVVDRVEQAPSGSSVGSADLEALLGAAIARLPEETRQALRSSLEAGLAASLQPAGYRLRTRVVAVVGRAP